MSANFATAVMSEIVDTLAACRRPARPRRSTVTRLGVVFLPQNPPERLRAIARAAEEAGLDELWLWEDCFLESGVATAAAALAWTERLRIGVGLLPVPLRNVAITAMEVATLDRLFPGRLTVGIGHGVQDWMGQVGARVSSPMTLLTEYLDALRALLRGERVTRDGRYVRLDGVALDWPPPTAPPIYLGVVRARTLQLAAEAGDGTILTGGTTPERVREVRLVLDEAADAAGRAGRQPIVVYLQAATGPTAAARMEAQRVRWGYGPDADVLAMGDAEAVAAAVRRWADAGADTVVLQPTPDDPDPEGFVRFVATEVRARLPE
jgi:alkanesulfonate monooxygenase SsuD/methylene tetrahydromethanopterin reductase-like flavin-dependent oxidoreductase (luciferase family)